MTRAPFALLTVLLAGCASDYDLDDSSAAALSCWDSNENRAGDPEEDLNGDGMWDAADCRGLSCWDLDGDGAAAVSEDTNGDGVWDAADCAGAAGAVGAAGATGEQGKPGLSCWDLDGDGEPDSNEDINSDGRWDAGDCQPAVDALLEQLAEMEASQEQLLDRIDALTAQLEDTDERVTTIADDYLTSDALVDHALQSDVDDLAARLDDLEGSGVNDLAGYIDIDTVDHAVRFVGVNVYVQSGEGTTSSTVNGLGNLIIGYDEDSSDDKSGSHNLVLGEEHSYTSYGGLITGHDHTVSGVHASAIGGEGALVSGDLSLIHI